MSELLTVSIRITAQAHKFMRIAKAELDVSQGEVVTNALAMYEEYLIRSGVLEEKVTL